MPIRIEWDDDTQRTLLFLRFDSRWNWAEFRQAVLRALEIIQDRDDAVDVIMDMLPCAPMQEFDGMTHIWWLLRQCRNGASGYFVLVSHDPVIRVVANMIRQSRSGMRQHILVARDEADARAILTYHRV